MTPHKWSKEIKAWADGAEIEMYMHDKWTGIDIPQWHQDNEYRIKPQPKKPQYLHVYSDDMGKPFFFWSKITPLKTDLAYEGKIKLEVDDENNS